MFRDYTGEGFLMEQLMYYSRMLGREYGIPYDDAWTMLVDVFDKKDLVHEEPVNYFYAVLEVENNFWSQGIKAYDWKYKK